MCVCTYCLLFGGGGGRVVVQLPEYNPPVVQLPEYNPLSYNYPSAAVLTRFNPGGTNGCFPIYPHYLTEVSVD